MNKRIFRIATGNCVKLPGLFLPKKGEKKGRNKENEDKGGYRVFCDKFRVATNFFWFVDFQIENIHTHCREKRRAPLIPEPEPGIRR